MGHYVWFSWFWSHLKMSKNVLCVVARLPQRLKSMLFEIFSHSSVPFGTAPFKKFQTTLILAFEANSALSRENETKIVIITHSVSMSSSLCKPVQSCAIWKKIVLIFDQKMILFFEKAISGRYYCVSCFICSFARICLILSLAVSFKISEHYDVQL